MTTLIILYWQLNKTELCENNEDFDRYIVCVDDDILELDVQ